MKTLIINGSPRKYGNCAQIIEMVKPKLGKFREFAVYHERVAPCNDCRACYKTGKCAKRDGMGTVLDDSFDNVIIISPVYMSTLPPPMLALTSRFQADYVAKNLLQKTIERRAKCGALILVGGGDGEPAHAVRMGKMILRNLNANPDDDCIIMSLKTDTVSAIDDDDFMQKLNLVCEKFLTNGS